MSASINHGGSAFPRSGFGESCEAQQDGMTMRQWYAGMAMQGILANTHFMAHILISNSMNGDAVALAARQAFLAADLMIAQETQPPHQ